MKNLISLLENLEYTLLGNESLLLQNVEDIAYSSHEAAPGKAFFCLIGAKADGHNFASDALKKGARIFFCQRKLNLPPYTLQVIVKNSRAALAKVSASFFSHPERKLAIIGVTGTKGKSTVCEMISHIFSCAGKKCAAIGTLGMKIDGQTEATENSTPESYIIYKFLARAVEKGAHIAVMEVSSQALCTHRVDGLHFAAAVFTNLSRDHIGTYEHPDFEHYKAAKKALFSKTDMAFINNDDLFGAEFARACLCPVQTYGTGFADIRAVNISSAQNTGSFGVSFSCTSGGEKAKFSLPQPGEFSALNALAASAVCRHFGVTLGECARALSGVNIRGRFEPVACARGDITCIIDYAHNAVSLEKAIETLREYTAGRIICVFGSVGGRTKERRRELAEVAARLADICVVTSDNPDFEEPAAIIEEIAAYIPAEKCFTEPDRAKAIAAALDLAESGDLLLFAGKGHEEYQLVRGKKLPFSERELIENHIFKKQTLIPLP